MTEVPQETRIAFGWWNPGSANAKQVGGVEVPFNQTLSQLPPALKPS